MRFLHSLEAPFTVKGGLAAGARMHGTILLVAVAVLATPAVAAVFNLDDGNFDTDLRGAGGSFVKFYVRRPLLRAHTPLVS